MQLGDIRTSHLARCCWRGSLPEHPSIAEMLRQGMVRSKALLSNRSSFAVRDGLRATVVVRARMPVAPVGAHDPGP